MAENIWWLIELADRLDIDIQKEMEPFNSRKRSYWGLKINKK